MSSGNPPCWCPAAGSANSAAPIATIQTPALKAPAVRARRRACHSISDVWGESCETWWENLHGDYIHAEPCRTTAHLAGQVEQHGRPHTAGGKVPLSSNIIMSKSGLAHIRNFQLTLRYKS
ncbi:unnamed protein product [Arctia plantaginis]|uniref:Uncharacterized protein n=1 Tax=Arctia plantaginis TaxID=874455 RepID=A0A8S1BQD2_ARCPL|nr:unnamed protein product [Arctia plantaginis]